ncbi:ibr finger domain protein [Moniliophthora roreri]|uniref:RBR-type E3 ubiquitin transferase n=1 Tax=Moniliophthora roreri TaxID=221103 RepID=A0A0W0FK65_MONRR|nr:ibr finger domain protein [Moniliophthora roreri]
MALPPALLVGLDLETSLLIAQLSLADIRQQLNRVTNEDEQYALQVMADDFDTYLKSYEDFRERASVVQELEAISKPPSPISDISTSSSSASSAVVDHENGENGAPLDHGHTVFPVSIPRLEIVEPVVTVESDWNPLTDDIEEQPNTLDTSTQNNPTSAIQNVECIACTESVPLPITLPTPCGHHFCQSCFETLLRTTITNETFFPPWCCGQDRRIDIEQITSVPSSGEGILTINDDLWFQLRAKSREYAVAPSERTYCPNPRCSIFLGSITQLKDEVEGSRRTSSRLTSTCLSCTTSFCLECKRMAHPGKDCEIEDFDDSMEELRKLAKEEKWQTCHGCKELVEKTSGCNHIVCRCKTEFCYACGGLWAEPCVCRS